MKLDYDIMKMLLSKGKGKGRRTRVKSTFVVSVEIISIWSRGFLCNIAACAGMWACVAFWCAGRGWRVLRCGGRVLVGGQGQEDRRIFRLDDCAEVVNVLLNPWEISGVSVNVIRVFGEAVPLQRVRNSDVRTRNFVVVWYSKVARFRVAYNRLACSFPIAEACSAKTSYELYRGDAEQFRSGACFEIVQYIANVLLSVQLDIYRVILRGGDVSDVLGERCL